MTKLNFAGVWAPAMLKGTQADNANTYKTWVQFDVDKHH